MIKYCVYAIVNKDNNKIYIGQTSNLEKRLKQHNQQIENLSKYTKKFSGEWKLFYKEVLKSRKEAIKREKQLKSYQGRLFLRKLLDPWLTRQSNVNY